MTNQPPPGGYPPPGYPPLPPPPPAGPQYAMWKVIVGGLLCSLGLSGLVFHFRAPAMIRDQRRLNPNLSEHVVKVFHDIADVALYVGLVSIAIGVLLILTAKKKSGPR